MMLVTGGLGFIGSHLIRHLRETDPAVGIVCVDAETYASNVKNLSVADVSCIKYYHANISDAQAMATFFDWYRPQVVINFAAETHVDRSIENSLPFLQSNVNGTHVLLECCRTFHTLRMVQISTDEVYGSLGPADPPFTEDSPLAPNNPYAASKAAADLLVRSYHKTYGLPAIITRCSNNYGPNQYPEKLIPMAIRKLLKGEPVPIYGDGLQVRDWIHVRDHCRAIDAVWRRGRVGEVYNVGGRNELTNVEMAMNLAYATDFPSGGVGCVEFVQDRQGHDRRYAMDSRKIEQELGWKPEVDFDDGLRETVEWYKREFSGER